MYKEYKSLNLPEVADGVLQKWQTENTFEQSIATRAGAPPFTFYEGPPSANGMPGIHHVMARAIKDIFCRYKTQKGFQVNRKAGWDTHGLPIELAVEKSLGITKEDIGKKITIEEYNKACRKEVMKYTDKWEELTRIMGYWVDMQDPYITYENEYIESVWWLLNDLFSKNLLYKGYTIQPYSPAAGTGLSSHEVNQPGSYRDVKDTSAIAMFKVMDKSNLKIDNVDDDVFFLAWTTTPWTLPSNTALAVGKKIDYVLVDGFNPITKKNSKVIAAKNLLDKLFPLPSIAALKKEFEKDASILNPEERAQIEVEKHRKIFAEYKGADLEGIRYEQLLPFSQPTDGDAFRVIIGDFVTTEDGTGIVHIAPSFGADDFRVAKQFGIGSLTLVDKRGKFLPEVQDGIFLFGEEYVKEAYLNDEEKETEFQKQKTILEGAGKIKELKHYLSVDDRIVLKLQEDGKLFKKEKYEHSYPHCWRTDKPILYYPLDSWFIKVTEKKDRMVELNKTINWKPESTGTGRFGNWLENANDWNLSRSRFWGIPLPIWRTEEGDEAICISSAEELKLEIEKSVAAGFMKSNPLAAFVPGDLSKENYLTFDLHKPYVDDIFLVSKSGKKMIRETDLIDVWFDSGSMPYAQYHFPFTKPDVNNNRSPFGNQRAFPADFIAEGVDQTRGWFYTLHAIATLCFDSVAYKNVVSNGLVLDKNGNKMSKRLGNAVDPFLTIGKYGPDATRWYMISNAQPWDNLKFNEEGITEVQRKFFGTLYNTYSFFALYANIDGFDYKEENIPLSQRTEIDRWIISLLNTLVKDVDESYADYEPTKATRLIQDFVSEHLSNWYVRLCRRRFWKGDYTQDKIAAYQTLYTCLETISRLMAPVAPFFADRLFCDLNEATGRDKSSSVHIALFPEYAEASVDKDLEERMQLAQDISSLVLGLRKKVNIRVRQPLQKLLLPALDAHFIHQVDDVKSLILAEVNVKEIEYVTEESGILKKKAKANFKTLGKRAGAAMKELASLIQTMNQEQIRQLEKEGKCTLNLKDSSFELLMEDVELFSEDIPGWQVASEGKLTVALDITISETLRNEGIARELINRLQNLRKDKGFEVTDKIHVLLKNNPQISTSVSDNKNYICAEILAASLEMVDSIDFADATEIEIEEGITTLTIIKKA